MPADSVFVLKTVMRLDASTPTSVVRINGVDEAFMSGWIDPMPEGIVARDGEVLSVTGGLPCSLIGYLKSETL